jgi:hypothetical protein
MSASVSFGMVMSSSGARRGEPSNPADRAVPSPDACRGASEPIAPPPPRRAEAGERPASPLAEVAAHDLLGGALGQLLVTVILRDGAARSGRWGTLMRHFLAWDSFGSVTIAVALLTSGVLVPAPEGPLVAPAGLALLLAAAQLRAPAAAVDVASVAARTDPGLPPASASAADEQAVRVLDRTPPRAATGTGAADEVRSSRRLWWSSQRPSGFSRRCTGPLRVSCPAASACRPRAVRARIWPAPRHAAHDLRRRSPRAGVDGYPCAASDFIE